MRQKTLRCLPWILLTLLVVCLVGVQAKADSVNYNLSANFSNGQQLTGQVVWDSTLNLATAYSFNLSNTTGTASCSSVWGLCSIVLNSFDGSKPVLLAGLLSPGESVLYITSGLWSTFSTTQINWSRVAVSVPEESALIELLCVMLTLLFVGRRATIFGLR
ncbi:MAG: hypothetical protein JST79_09915 [Acidobacteria bacterium]|jgi:hypothetical protein|nr:hypothetical protein [Acidobacteriota bacterium]